MLVANQRCNIFVDAISKEFTFHITILSRSMYKVFVLYILIEICSCCIITILLCIQYTLLTGTKPDSDFVKNDSFCFIFSLSIIAVHSKFSVDDLTKYSVDPFSRYWVIELGIPSSDYLCLSAGTSWNLCHLRPRTNVLIQMLNVFKLSLPHSLKKVKT